MKKDWMKPNMTVLIRSNSEESVLATCKSDHQGPVSSGAGWGMCASMCSECYDQGDS